MESGVEVLRVFGRVWIADNRGAAYSTTWSAGADRPTSRADRSCAVPAVRADQAGTRAGTLRRPGVSDETAEGRGAKAIPANGDPAP